MERYDATLESEPFQCAAMIYDEENQEIQCENPVYSHGLCEDHYRDWRADDARD